MIPLFLLRSSPLGSAGGGLACCTVAATTIYAMRKKIPHPSEFAIIGCCCLNGGCHKHEKFNLIVEVHDAGNIPKGPPVYVYVECGRFDAQTTSNKVDTKTLEVPIFERLKIHVRQMDDVITISLYRKGRITSTLLGSLDMSVVEDIIEKNYPQLQWYSLKKDNKLTVKLRLSFHRLSCSIKNDASPLIEFAILRASREAQESGVALEAMNFEALDDREKLHFLSRVLEGPLYTLSGTRWIEYYFKATGDSQDRWRWSYWTNKESMLNGGKAVGHIPLLAISLILPDKHNRHIFYVKYHKHSGVHDLFLSRVDRDRNLWSDGLYEFILMLRAYLETHPHSLSHENCTRQQGQNHTEREKVTLRLGRRTLALPQKQSTLASIENDGLRYRQPKCLLAMVDEAMQGYDDDRVNRDNKILMENPKQLPAPPDSYVLSQSTSSKMDNHVRKNSEPEVHSFGTDDNVKKYHEEHS